MKTPSILPASFLRIVLAGLSLSLATGTALADNPLKFLRSKAKQGLSKVARAVNPKRVVSVVRTVNNAAVDAVPTTRVSPAAGREYYYYESRPPAYYYQQNTRAMEVPESTSPPYPTSRTEYYTAPSYQQPSYRAPAYGGYQADPRSGAVPDALSTRPRILRDSAPETPPIRQKPMERNAVPNPAETPLEITRNPPATSSTPSGGTPSQSLTKSRSEPETSNPAPSPSSNAPRTSREDLPFGELVAGKTGFVYSPYSKKELVDVSGIPTGTKVKCPYSGKTFRVP